MGNFRIVINAVGGHGDAREVLDGGQLSYKNYPANSVDAVAFEAIDKLKQRGCTITDAKLMHWPDTVGEVVDDLKTQRRNGSFHKQAEKQTATR
jgi:hypothetical protein